MLARADVATLGVALATAVFMAAPGASAQELRYSPSADLAVTVGGAAAWAISERLRAHLTPAACRWCDRDPSGDDTLNGLDRAMRQLRWGRHNAADALSDVAAFFVTPVATAGTLTWASAHDGRFAEFGGNTLVVAEAGVVAADINQLVKFLAVRERPDAHARALSDDAVVRVHHVDDDLSFYSGHTTEAVALAVAGGTVASLRGYRWAPLVWSVGLPPALVTGYLRMAADRHYFTDVLAGAIGGAAIGFLMPYLFHRPESQPAPHSLASTSEYSVAFNGSF
jgi:membrane-associated phospholipid phosphatase